MPAAANDVTTRSSHRPGRSAAATAAGSASRTDSATARNVSSSVGPMRCASSVETGWCEKYETPRLPCRYAGHPAQVLADQRPVQAGLGPQPLDGVLVDALRARQPGKHRVTWQGPQDSEDENRRRDHHEDADRYPLHDVAHRLSHPFSSTSALVGPDQLAKPASSRCGLPPPSTQSPTTLCFVAVTVANCSGTKMGACWLTSVCS